jgi:hypothetical protein
MAKAGDKGIPLEDYLKTHPWPQVRAQLDRGELPYEWTDRDGCGRASDDAGSHPPPGYLMKETTRIDYKRGTVSSWAHLPPWCFPPMYSVRVFPATAPVQAPAKVTPTDSGVWLSAAVARRELAGNIPVGWGWQTAYARELAEEMAAAVRAGTCRHAMKADVIRVRLHDKKLLPRR